MNKVDFHVFMQRSLSKIDTNQWLVTG